MIDLTYTVGQCTLSSETKGLEVVDTERSLKIQKGLELIPRLGEVMPSRAGSETNLIYESVEQRLRVPFVNFVLRVLDNYPTHPALAWGTRCKGVYESVQRPNTPPLLPTAAPLLHCPGRLPSGARTRSTQTSRPQTGARRRRGSG